MPITTGLMSSLSYDWATPNDYFQSVNAEFSFDLDVCASDWNYKCDRYFTIEDDGLSQDWRGVCWMNPPYGREIAAWMKKAFDSSVENGATVVCLVPARTDTAWWHDYAMKGEIRFLRGRLKFQREDGTGDSAPFPSALVIFKGGL